MTILIALAVLAMPLGMTGGSVAVAAPHHGPAMSAVGEHCPETPAPAGELPGASIECMMSCAALPAALAAPGLHTLPPQPLPAAGPASGLHGLSPEAATPPPRIA